jgi:hypothetical protein
MTLKEKFRNDELNLSNLESIECEKIADEFAIGFYKWGKENAIKYTLLGNIKTHKELLEIYKKEKGYDAKRKI